MTTYFQAYCLGNEMRLSYVLYPLRTWIFIGPEQIDPFWFEKKYPHVLSLIRTSNVVKAFIELDKIADRIEGETFQHLAS